MTTIYAYSYVEKRLITLSGSAKDRRKQRRALKRQGAVLRGYDGGAGRIAVNLPATGGAAPAKEEK